MIEHIVIALGIGLSFAPHTPPLSAPTAPPNTEQVLSIIHDRDRRYTKRRENKTKRPKRW